jgi:hypothetical protein
MGGSHSIQERREQACGRRHRHPHQRRPRLVPQLPEGSECLAYSSVSAIEFAALLAPLPLAQQLVLVERQMQLEMFATLWREAHALGYEVPGPLTAQRRRLEKRQLEREERARIAAA